jgi:competence protein ComEC
MGINPAALSRIKALTFGDATSIRQPLWEIFSKTGTTHLVVISGSHISLIAGVVYLIVMRLWAWTGLLNWSPQKVAALSALIAAIFYALLAGFSVPTLRALVMVIVVMAAIILQRNDRPFHTLA